MILMKMYGLPKVMLLFMLISMFSCKTKINLGGEWVDINGKVLMVIDDNLNADIYYTTSKDTSKAPFLTRIVNIKKDSFALVMTTFDGFEINAKGVLVDEKHLLLCFYKSKRGSAGKIDEIQFLTRRGVLIDELRKELPKKDTIFMDSKIYGLFTMSCPTKKVVLNDFSSKTYHIINNFLEVKNGIDPMKFILNNRVFIDNETGRNYKVYSKLNHNELNELDDNTMCVYQLGFNQIGHDVLWDLLGVRQTGEHEYFYLGKVSDIKKEECFKIK